VPWVADLLVEMWKKQAEQLQAEVKRLEEIETDLNSSLGYVEMWKKQAEQFQAELDKYRWIPVNERLPELKDRNKWSIEIDDGTINVIGWDNDVVFITNYFPKMGVWNGLTPVLWKPIILPEQALKGGVQNEIAVSKSTR